MLLLKLFNGKALNLNKRLMVILSLILVAGMNEQVWAQTAPFGDAELAIPEEELNNPNFVPGSGSIFIRQAGANTVIQEWDPITKLLVNQFVPIGSGNGRGLAFDGTDLWYSNVFDPLIHKVAITGGPDITTIPAPAPGLSFVGGLDYDFSTNTLLVISDSGGVLISQISVINPADGTLLADCTNAKPTNTETFAIAVDPLGNTFWSNAGLFATNLDEYFLPTIPNQGPCTPTGNSFNPTSVGAGAVDFDIAGNFITVSPVTGIVYDLNGNPAAPPVDSFPTGILVSDLTTMAVPVVVGGEVLSIDSPALMLAGLQSSAIWMLPVLAGATGVGAFYIKTRMSKE